MFDKDLQPDLLEPAIRRHSRSAAELVRGRRRARRNPALQCQARPAAMPSAIDDAVSTRLDRYLAGGEPFSERFAERGLVIEMRANRMPDGGLVTTFTDITPSVEAAEALERANETLERRVRERTEQLTRLNIALGAAPREQADEANISKTNFLAAASHDILQPLNAARLYVTSLLRARRQTVEDGAARSEHRCFARSGRGNPRRVARHFAARYRRDEARSQRFRIADLLRQIEVEFAPLAQSKGLELVFVPCSLTVRSDRRLLRRLLQNLVSNAIKYTPKGRVLVGCRRLQRRAARRCLDTGARHSQSQAARHLHRIPSARSRRTDRPRSRARPVDRRAHCPRARA